jgi:hypothetical protein
MLFARIGFVRIPVPAKEVVSKYNKETSTNQLTFLLAIKGNRFEREFEREIRLFSNR